MGEIILSICIGGFLVLAGIIMNIVLFREEKKYCANRENSKPS